MQGKSEEIKVSSQETTLLMSKSVTDAEQPKMILCYKESTYDIIKDICVDCEGLQQNEITKDVKTSNDSITISAGNLPKEGQDMSKIVEYSNDLKSTETERAPVGEIVVEQPDNHQSPRRSSRKYSLADLLAEDREFDKEQIQMLSPADESNLGQTDQPIDSKSRLPIDSQDLQAVQSLTQENSSMDQDVKVKQEEIKEEEASHLPVLIDSGSNPLEKLGDSQSTVELSVLEPLNLVKIGSNAGAIHPVIPEKESQQVSEIEQCQEIGGQTVVARSSVNRANEDPSLLGPSFLSGGIMYSGHLQYSGSVSLRSESSVTSNRSFAFPVLQSEWNSSPIKMARVERRQFRRRRSWHSGLFCCRF